jgi:hypothetical protein
MSLADESTFYVDIPTRDCINNPDGACENVATFKTRQEAIDFAKEHFGADDEGRFQPVTGG